MKPVFQAVLLLGLAIPVYSTTPKVDFDDAHAGIQPDGILDLKILLPQQFPVPSPGVGIASDGVAFEPRQGLSAPLKDSTASPVGETKMFRIIENGVAVELPAAEVVDGKGYYKITPNYLFEHKIWCSSQSGYWGVCYDYKFDPKLAGHNHTANIPPYTWNGQDIPAHRCYNNIPVTTTVVFYFKAPEFATRADHTAQITGACYGPVSNIVDIKIDGLAALAPAWSDSLHGGVTYYNLVGATTHHPINHFAKPQTIDLIKEIAWQYHAKFPAAEVLNVNDISLKWGGLFDISGAWTMLHEFHRYGRQADFRLPSIPEGNRERFKQISCDLGVEVELHSKDHKKLDPLEAAMWERTDFNTLPWKFLNAEELDARVPHYHLVFPKYDTNVDDPTDQTPQGCPPSRR